MKHLLAALLLLSLIACSPAKAQDPDVKMHRTQATTKGPGGWYFAKSTEGKFSVLLPVSFNDFTITVNDSAIGEIKTYGIGSKTAEGIKFSITETPITPRMNKFDTESLLKNFTDDGTGTLSQVDRKSFLGNPAVSFKTTDAQGGAFIKYIISRKSLYTVILEYPVDQDKIAASYVDRFFNSLKIL